MVKNQIWTYIVALTKPNKIFPEESHNFSTSGLPSRYLYTLCGLRSKINHLLELGVLKGLDGLWKLLRLGLQEGRKLYLISGNKPLQCCMMKKSIWVLDNLWLLLQMTSKRSLFLFDYSLFAFLDISRESRLEVILQSPLMINALSLMSI